MLPDRKCSLLLLLAILLVGAARSPTGVAAAPDPVQHEHEYAPIVERDLAFYDFTLKDRAGKEFNLKQYAADKQLVIVAFVAGWCWNSNQNGPLVEKLFQKYHDRGLGIVDVLEYSADEEVKIFVNRFGIDYPLVIETQRLSERKRSLHYRYRKATGDKRQWGTPFYVIIDTKDIVNAEPGVEASPDKKGPTGPLLTNRFRSVSGELDESEIQAFIEARIGPKSLIQN